jgi:A/G-specific adenine glycosylase
MNQRQLPWRETSEPYKIWLSEVMLQQTRVAQGLPYYERFLSSFPTVFELAKAPQQRVLRLWQGLGYYSRARNLHRCAKLVVENFKGRFPTSFEELKQLPGIGPYSAAAIASIAFRQPVAVVDGNVFRVLARLFGIEKDIASSEGKAYFFSLANSLIDHERPDLYNQALMEFGALQCVPRNPKCTACIFAKSCEANQKNEQGMLPVKSKKRKVKTRYFYYFVIRYKAKTLMRERPAGDIWQGLNDFYLIETSRREKSESLMKNDKILSQLAVSRESKIYRHTLTHQKLVVRFITLQPSSAKQMGLTIVNSGLKWYTAKKAEQLPKPILIERFLKEKNHDRDFW